MRTKNKPSLFNIRLTGQERDLLARVAAEEERSRAVIFRRWLRAEAEKRGFLPEQSKPKGHVKKPTPLY